jgi:hypothetical protein
MTGLVGLALGGALLLATLNLPEPTRKEIAGMLPTTVLASALLSVSVTALAYTGTEAEQGACRHDANKFCRAVIHESEERVGQCLILNASKISKACQDVLRAHGQL